MSATDTVNAITNELSRIFRHIVPGAVVLGSIYWSHTSQFAKVQFNNGYHLIILALVALVIGNLWYVVHRYTIHNFFDWVCYCIRNGKWRGYLPWLFKHIQQSFALPDSQKELRNFIHFRSAQVIFLFITSEAIIIFSLWNESDSFFDKNQTILLICGIAVFVVAMVQFWIVYNLDVEVVNKNTQKTRND